MTVGKRSMKSFSMINRRHIAAEFSAHHCPGITADRRLLVPGNIGSGREAALGAVPGERARAGRVSLGIAITRPGRGVARFRIVIPNESFSAIFGALISAIG